jgi:hypothetical protein
MRLLAGGIPVREKPRAGRKLVRRRCEKKIRKPCDHRPAQPADIRKRNNNNYDLAKGAARR